jgi:hypothetical protein
MTVTSDGRHGLMYNRKRGGQSIIKEMIQVPMMYISGQFHRSAGFLAKPKRDSLQCQWKVKYTFLSCLLMNLI